MKRLNQTACLIGSMRYINKFYEVARIYTELGYNVLYSPFDTYDGSLDDDKREELFLQSSLDRIDMSDLVIVVDGSTNGAIGYHTSVEIAYAVYKELPIIFVPTENENHSSHDLPLLNDSHIFYSSSFSKKLAIMMLLFKIKEVDYDSNLIVTRFDLATIKSIMELAKYLKMDNMIDILTVSDDLKINETEENDDCNQDYGIIMSGNLYKGDKLISADVTVNNRLMYTSSTGSIKYIGCYWTTDRMIYMKMNSSGLFRIKTSLFDTRLHECRSYNKQEPEDEDKNESKEAQLGAYNDSKKDVYHVYEFFDDIIQFTNSGSFIGINVLYLLYSNYCHRNSWHPVPIEGFYSIIELRYHDILKLFSGESLNLKDLPNDPSYRVNYNEIVVTGGVTIKDYSLL